MLFCSARSAVSRRTRGRGLPFCAERGDRADLHGAEAERAEAAEPARVLVDAGRDPERALEAQPERLDGERRVRAAEHPQQPEPVRQRHATGGERVGGLGRDAPQDERVEEAVEHAAITRDGRTSAPRTRARCAVGPRLCGAVGPVRVDVVDRRQRLVGRVARRRAGSPPRRRRAGRAPRSTPQTSWPSARTASIACTVEPPVVTTSSTIRQRSPCSSGGPSMRRWRPCCLTSLRTKNAFTSAPPASAAQAGASAPIVSPPTAVASHWRA